jgi:hypothetical protein
MDLGDPMRRPASRASDPDELVIRRERIANREYPQYHSASPWLEERLAALGLEFLGAWRAGVVLIRTPELRTTLDTPALVLDRLSVLEALAVDQLPDSTHDLAALT